MTFGAFASGHRRSSVSPNNFTVIAPSTAPVIDSFGHHWTIVATNGGQVAFDGATVAATGNVIELAYVNGTVWQENSLGNWYSFAPGAPTDTGVGPTTSPLPGGGTQAIRTFDFVDSIGVNIHMNFPGPIWGVWSILFAAMTYLGINNVRDAIPGGGATAPYIDAMNNHNLKFTYQITGQNFNDPNAFAGPIGVLDTLRNAATSGGVRAIEGFNEPENWPVAYNSGGTSSPQSTQNAMVAFYNAVRADTTLNGIPVLDLSTAYYYNTTLFQSIAGRADAQNQHVYPDLNLNIASAFSSDQALQYNSTGLPKYITEFGYFTATDTSGDVFTDGVWTAVNNAEQGRRLITGLLDGWTLGYKRIFIYDLFDAFRSTAANDSLGLFNYGAGSSTTLGAPKASATNIQSLTTVLNDAGATAATFSPGSLQYSTNAVAGDKTILMALSTGGFRIAVWNDTGGAHTFTLTLTTPATINRFTILSGSGSVQTATAATTFSFTLTNDPVILSVV